MAVWDTATGEPHPSSPQVREASRSHNGPIAVGNGFVATAAYEQLRQWDIYSTAPPQQSTVPYEPESEEGDGVLLAEYRAGSEPVDVGPYGLRLLDEDLETEREYELPAPDPDEESSD